MTSYLRKNENDKYNGMTLHVGDSDHNVPGWKKSLHHSLEATPKNVTHRSVALTGTGDLFDCRQPETLS